ncbi:hypothetical protein GQ42DRAFT_76704 [Ramicandelaber brevisporus]|nr:hypothetical protein GQ42DRAFT_76704 [Ramicandelaber brevisporus]
MMSCPKSDRAINDAIRIPLPVRNFYFTPPASAAAAAVVAVVSAFAIITSHYSTFTLQSIVISALLQFLESEMKRGFDAFAADSAASPIAHFPHAASRPPLPPIPLPMPMPTTRPQLHQQQQQQQRQQQHFQYTTVSVNGATVYAADRPTPRPQFNVHPHQIRITPRQHHSPVMNVSTTVATAAHTATTAAHTAAATTASPRLPHVAAIPRPPLPPLLPLPPPPPPTPATSNPGYIDQTPMNGVHYQQRQQHQRRRSPHQQQNQSPPSHQDEIQRQRKEQLLQQQQQREHRLLTDALAAITGPDAGYMPTTIPSRKRLRFSTSAVTMLTPSIVALIMRQLPPLSRFRLRLVSSAWYIAYDDAHRHCLLNLDYLQVREGWTGVVRAIRQNGDKVRNLVTDGRTLAKLSIIEPNCAKLMPNMIRVRIVTPSPQCRCLEIAGQFPLLRRIEVDGNWRTIPPTFWHVFDTYIATKATLRSINMCGMVVCAPGEHANSSSMDIPFPTRQLMHRASQLRSLRLGVFELPTSRVLPMFMPFRNLRVLQLPGIMEADIVHCVVRLVCGQYFPHLRQLYMQIWHVSGGFVLSDIADTLNRLRDHQDPRLELSLQLDVTAACRQQSNGETAPANAIAVAKEVENERQFLLDFFGMCIPRLTEVEFLNYRPTVPQRPATGNTPPAQRVYDPVITALIDSTTCHPHLRRIRMSYLPIAQTRHILLGALNSRARLPKLQQIDLERNEGDDEDVDAMFIKQIDRSNGLTVTIDDWSNVTHP